MATALGVVVCIAPIATAVGAVAFGLSFAVKRIVSLSSMIATVAFAVAQFAWLIPEPFTRASWPLTAFSIAAPLLILIRHRDNIIRILRGDEKAYRTADEPPPASQ
jgi:glycerol-3-phosphate acyltransferase PlsY